MIQKKEEGRRCVGAGVIDWLGITLRRALSVLLPPHPSLHLVRTRPQSRPWSDREPVCVFGMRERGSAWVRAGGRLARRKDTHTAPNALAAPGIAVSLRGGGGALRAGVLVERRHAQAVPHPSPSPHPIPFSHLVVRRLGRALIHSDDRLPLGGLPGAFKADEVDASGNTGCRAREVEVQGVDAGEAGDAK